MRRDKPGGSLFRRLLEIFFQSRFPIRHFRPAEGMIFDVSKTLYAGRGGGGGEFGGRDGNDRDVFAGEPQYFDGEIVPRGRAALVT